jgi:hypothetical protein
MLGWSRTHLRCRSGAVCCAGRRIVALRSRSCPAGRRGSPALRLQLIDASNAPAAFPYLHEALCILPDDPTLNRIREISHALAIRTTPRGAEIYVKPYTTPAT